VEGHDQANRDSAEPVDLGYPVAFTLLKLSARRDLRGLDSPLCRWLTVFVMFGSL
jgi:hypothetical protein